ncbi:MAG: MBL fold metallo-hydrolase [Sphaerobacter sp.]|nr:MBL fold metallo-hydrolase [Sphaerobacter sp.]
MVEGNVVRVGDLQLAVLETPGHAAGHVRYVLRQETGVAVFAGDAIFFGGKILLQDTWDCSLQESIRSVERLAALAPEGFYPGHLTFTVRHGHRQLEPALAAIRNRLPPPPLA